MEPIATLKLGIIALTLTWGVGRPALAADAEVALVQEGRSRFTIVHAPDAPGSVRTGAEELQRYVEKVTKAKLPIVVGDAPQSGPFIALGDTSAARAAGISARDLPLEGFRLVSRAGNLFIVGPDTADGELTPEGGTSAGTRNGVYTFLEDYLDVRWLLPGPLGEDVPERATVRVPATLDRKEQPAFKNRQVPDTQQTLPAVQEWSARHKLGFSMAMEHAHNWDKIVPATLQAEHPDWFPEVDGKRPPVVGDRYKVETTNPGLIQHIAQAAIEAFRRDPNLKVFSLSPTDSGNWSTSAESKAFYDKDPHGKLSITPLILKFYNDVARIVGKEFPDRKLSGYIYSAYLYPPSVGTVHLEPNLYIVIAPQFGYGYQLYRKGVTEEWDRVMNGWSPHTSRIWYFDHFIWLRGSRGALTPPAPDILNFVFPRLVKHGVTSVFIYGIPEWSQAAVSNYALAKMEWNPALDAHALCEEFYRRAYGPAASAPMRELTQLVDAAVKDFYNRDLTANYTLTPRYQKEVLAANYARIEERYLQARESAKGNAATPGQRARLEFFGDNLIVMQSLLRAAGFLPETKASPLYREEAEIDRMMGRMHPGFGVELAPGMKRTEKLFPPVRAEWIPALPKPRPLAPIALRGRTRFLFFPNADQEIRIGVKSVSAHGGLVRCDAYSATGPRVAGGVLRAGSPVQFLGSAGQVYYVEIDGGASSYELELSGAPYALAANSDPRGLHLVGKATPLYFRVPADVAEFALTVSSGSPGETSLSRLYTPSGNLIETLDTQSSPVARARLTRAKLGDDWEGYWCLAVEKAPRGGFDDVYVALDAALPPWFTLDPAAPLNITALKNGK